jgi:hypothetical protein
MCSYRLALLVVLALGAVHGVVGLVARSSAGQGFTKAASGPGDVAAFIQARCWKCHGQAKPAGGLRLDDLPADPSKDVERWLAVRNQVREGLMPPAKEPRPDAAEVRTIVNWITVGTGAIPSRLPNQGNLIPHELLFGKTTDLPDASDGRLWRLNPESYFGFVDRIIQGKVTGNKSKGLPGGLIQPFTLVDDRGIRDFSGLYSIDEPSTEVLLRNAAMIVDLQVGDGGKQKGIADLAAVYHAANPSRSQIESAVQLQFRLAIGRKAAPDEMARYLALYEKCARNGDTRGAVKTVLQAVLLRSDAIFRSEIGGGAADAHGRRMLAPLELVDALSLALGNRRDATLLQAAENGQLTTRAQVAVHVKRLLDDPSIDKPRIMNFFREYFEYHKAEDVFKEKPKDFLHAPRTLIADTDRLVAYIVAKDTDVFRQLLTTELSFVSYSLKANKNGPPEPQPAHVANNNNKGKQLVEHVYGFEKWPAAQPVTMPPNTRIGVLMQPSWLVAWGTNFDNDPVRRGRWIRERLLGGTVPELPIGVAAQIPDDPHRTLRDRLTVTRDARCWKCHQKMDELGLPFEQFDHFGRFRTTETVQDPKMPPPKNAKGKALGTGGFLQVPLVTTGIITDSGDPRLDGPVKDPREMIRKIADSDLARQVFVRHVFRYFMGRNETLSDARTLQEADRAYVASGGSFKALVYSLLTSEVFLYRRSNVPTSN